MEQCRMLETEKEQLIAELRAAQKQLSALLESVADVQDWQPDPEEWSFRYIAAHLATVDKDCFMDRIVRLAAGENPHFARYFNTGWDFSRIEMKDALQDWTLTRQEIFALVRALPAEKCLLTGTHPTFGTMTVLTVLEVMRNHDREHLQHLERLIEEHKAQKPRRLSLD